MNEREIKKVQEEKEWRREITELARHYMKKLGYKGNNVDSIDKVC
jgi:hypothetical protein